MLVNLHERVFIDNAPDHIAHIVGVVGIGRHDGGQFVAILLSCLKRQHGRALLTILRQVAQQPAHLLEAVDVVGSREVGNPRPAGVCHGSSQFLGAHLLIGNRLDYIGTRHKHITGVLHHDRKVCHGRRIHRPPGTGAHDGRNLRDHTRCHHVAVKNIGIATQRAYTFLDACTAGVVETNDRCTVFHGKVHDLADFFCMGLRQ